MVLSDDDFTEFTVNSTEIVTRIKLNADTKTVDKDKGALWTQESLPSDTLLMSVVSIVNSRLLIDDEREKDKDGKPKKKPLLMAGGVEDWLRKNLPPRIQLGGDETTGQGFVAVRFADSEAK